ncbi:MAG: UDP-3-O-(3-hydroxymyristoyl)glucosamine N-acyltransferase [Verrucomicrobia bacterium]|nr:UDP-3-O-(3-hydroxymyristoyl)glucosamine N-acyltransferase [Verrucomicrobiota bacterium]
MQRSFTLAELSELTHSSLVGNPAYRITGVEALDSAGPEDASFLANPRYRPLLKQTQAGVICVDSQTPLEEGKNFLVSENPSRTFQTLIEALLISPENFTGFEGIHPTAIVHPSAIIEKDVQIGPCSVVDQGCVIGEGSRIASHVSIGPGVKMGKNCQIHPHVTIREKCTLGDRVILQPGAVIGSCGFGYVTDATGNHIKLEQLGTVVLEDDVEIGANTTIDRARFKTTLISQGSKIDNLVQIGHNVSIGPHNIIVSQTGIAGSAKTGRHVIIGGQAGIVGHIEITDQVMIATRGGVSKSITQPGKYAGSPVMSLADSNRQQVQLRKISDYVKQIEHLENRLKELENKIFTSPVA